METLKITYVDPEPSASGWYRITAGDRSTYITKDMWVASLCKRARDLGCDVKLWSWGGCYTRRITHVELVTEERAAV